MWHSHLMGPAWGFGFGGILMFVWWIFVIGLIVSFVRLMLHGPRGHRHWRHDLGRSSALDILEERYAKGEIDKAEFEERRQALRK